MFIVPLLTTLPPAKLKGDTLKFVTVRLEPELIVKVGPVAAPN
jgi:hypothetical protein